MGDAAFDAFAVPDDGQSLKKRSFRGSLLTAGGQVIKLGLQLISQLVLARLLFPADFGLLAMAYPVITLANLFNDIGIGESIVQRQTISHQQVSTLFWISIGISLLLAVLVVLSAPLAALIYHDRRIVLLLATLALMLPIGAAGGIPTSILVRQMRFGVLVRVDIAAAATGLVTTILCAVAGEGYWSLVWGQFALALTQAVMGWIACRWRPLRWGNWRSVIDDLRFGGNVTGANLATFVSTSADNVIIGLFNGPAALGLYDRSYRLVVQPVGQLLSPVSRVALPLLSRHVNQPAEYRSIYLDMVRALNLAAVPLMIFCVVDGQELVDVLLGPRWTAAGHIFRWIAFGGLAAAVNASAVWLFISQNQTASLRRYSTASAVTNLTAFTIGATLGITYVAAIAAMTFVFVSAPLMLYGATRTGIVRFQDVILTCLASVAPALLVVGIDHLVRKAGLAPFLQLIVMGPLTYATFAAFVPFVGSQRLLVRNIGGELKHILNR